MVFRNRADAGRRLANALVGSTDLIAPLVLGVARGGVVVAEPVAVRLGAPLDVFVVRKLGVPGYEELAMGAITSGGTRFFNQEVIDHVGVDEEALGRVGAKECEELERRERVYRADLPPVSVAGRVVVLVDDGLATGASMRVAIEALRRRHAAWIVVAVPVSPLDTRVKLGKLADRLVCLWTPEPFGGVGRWYEDFSQITDAEVRAALHRSARRAEISPPVGMSA